MATKKNKRATKNKQRLVAKATRKKQTPLEKEYAKQRKRITNYIARKKRQGYEIKFVIPARPKRITKASISRLVKITPKQILKRSTKKQLAPTPHYSQSTDNVLLHIQEMIAKFDTTGMTAWEAERQTRHKNILSNVLEGAIMIEGREAVAERLEQHSTEIIELIERLMYGNSKEEAFQVDLTNFAEILKGGVLTSSEAIEVQDEGDMYDI